MPGEKAGGKEVMGQATGERDPGAGLQGTYRQGLVSGTSLHQGTLPLGAVCREQGQQNSLQAGQRV